MHIELCLSHFFFDAKNHVSCGIILPLIYYKTSPQNVRKGDRGKQEVLQGGKQKTIILEMISRSV